MDPITRQEQYLNAIAGGDNDVPETPQTREEWFLNQILENGDTKLDAPTTAGTSGQVLTSDGNGGQVWATVGSGSIVVDNTLSVEGAAADAKKAGEEIADLKSAIEQVEDIVVIKSDNLYNPALQTSDTISPHYYFNGVPYSSTQFDSTWNCTALIEVEPSTKYTVGLVPAINDVTKPWNAASQGVFCYDANGDYITGSASGDNTFTTPATTKYIRFNYQITSGFSLANLNAKCMLVKGETLPSTYEAYVNTNLKAEVDALAEKVVILPIWYKRTGTTIEAGYNYGNGKNVIVTVKQYGGNNLLDINKAETITKGDDYETATRTTVYENGSDGFSPYVVAAVNNIDGDNPTSQRFSGGNHQYNNQGSGSTATARTVSVDVYADGVVVADGGKGYANRLLIKWENRIQAYNTEKSDGTGREVLKVVHTAEFDGVDIKVSTSIYPLEDVKMYVFYGFQTTLGSSRYPRVRYYTSANRLVNIIESGDTTFNSGDLIGYSYHAEDADASRALEVSIDPMFDLGRRTYATGQNAMFTSNIKGYFSIVRNETSMAKDTIYALKGAYKFFAP